MSDVDVFSKFARDMAAEREAAKAEKLELIKQNQTTASRRQNMKRKRKNKLAAKSRKRNRK